VLNIEVATPATSFDPKLPVLDAVATISENGRILFLAVINRNEAEQISANLSIEAWASRSGVEVRVFELNGKNKVAENPYESTENVNIQEKTLPVEHAPLAYRFPAHSVTVIELSGERSLPK
jgi:alpha-L-arabinofuranosidase